MEGPEVPILDGSAAPFVRLIRSTGTVLQPRLRKYLVVQKPFNVSDGDRQVSLLPCPEFMISFGIQFDHPAIGSQSFRLRLSEEDYEKEISSARTFGFLRDVEAMKAQGYALGGSLENALVLDEKKVLNSGGLRYQDEFVRHKVLDSVGDLSLIGFRLLGHFVAHKAGHSLNHRLLKHLMESPVGWKIISSSKMEHGEAGYWLPSTHGEPSERIPAIA